MKELNKCSSPITSLSKLPLFFLLFAISCNQPERDIDINGEVFIVTQGGQNIKLGLVEVNVISEIDMKPFVQMKTETAASEHERLMTHQKKLHAEFEQAKERLLHPKNNDKDYGKLTRLYDEKRFASLRATDESLRFLNGKYYVSGIPTPVQVVKTDAEGKFSLKLKKGRYGIASAASRKVGDSDEYYYWLVWQTIDVKIPQKVLLSNDNLLVTNCTDCAVKMQSFNQ